MKEFSITNKEKLRRIDPVILFCVLGMNIMSIITLAASSDAYGVWYVKTQTLASAIGFVCMAALTFIDYEALFTKLKYVFFALSVTLLVVVFFFGEGSMGNANWLPIPGTSLSWQPSEFVKISFMITFALHLNYVKKKINHPWSVIQLLLHAGLIVGLVMLTGDLGMALVYMAIMIFMLFASGISLWYMLGGFFAVVIASPILWTFLTDKQQRRILIGFNPDLDPLDLGMQQIASRNAIISGGFRGAGFSGGSKYFSIPEGQSDCLFAVHAEKFGFIGAFLYVALITVLIARILWLAGHSRKNYASFICVGIAGMLIAQSVENIGMCLGMLPVVGITLPFFSYGSSSIISAYICIGLVQSISTHNKKYYFERESG
ncbi:MAG: rod shape-determining protein RodA [Clostridia bacterium]|nr:rod shape-determining protein RodA [Clostridia bacterium]